MNTKKQTGDSGENLARDYLLELGFTILDQNVSNKFGEIDLIARRGKIIHFIEIRTRTGRHDYGLALESLQSDKLRRFYRASEAIHYNHPEWKELIPYLSVIAIDELADGTFQIEFLQDVLID